MTEARPGFLMTSEQPTVVFQIWTMHVISSCGNLLEHRHLRRYIYHQKLATSILSIPVELLTSIFEACDDFPQVVALASVCKHTYAAWATDPGIIIWRVGKTQIRSFEDALLAVRATAIVLKACQAGTLPPLVAMNSLSAKSKLPDLAELKEVFNMQNLVRCMEWMYFNSEEYHSGQDSEYNLFPYMKYGTYPAARRRFPGCLSEDIPGTKNATIDSFRDRFYRAMYRVLLAGAVLARAYMAPLFRARKEGKKGFFARCGLEDFVLRHWDETDPNYVDASEFGPPREEDIAYIRQFPVYNYDVLDWSQIGVWRYQEYETCFGPFASWIVEDRRKRQQSEPQDPNDVEPDWAENPADVGAVKELMLLMVAYDHLNCKFENQAWSGVPEAAYMQKPGHLLGNRPVSVVRFGTFQIEEVTMPAAFEDVTRGHLFAEYHPALKGSEGEDIPWQFDVWSIIWGQLDERRRNVHTNQRENPGPPAMLEM